MKQGRAVTHVAATKVEPKSKAINVRKVADIGIQQVRTRPYKDMGEGFKAPAPRSTTHSKSGSQGKH